MESLVLKKPLTIDDEEKKSIEYDFESVKPVQYINLVKRLSKKQQIAVPELDMDVQIGYFSLASSIAVSDLKRVESTQDFTKMCSLARDFLLDSSEEEEEETNN